MEDGSGRGGKGKSGSCHLSVHFPFSKGEEEQEAVGTASRTDSVQRHADLPFQHESLPSPSFGAPSFI